MKEYFVIYEEGPESWGAYSPDLPGCISVGDTYEEVVAMMAEAMELHVDFLRSEGLPVPEPSGRVAA